MSGSPFKIFARRFAHTVAGIVTTLWVIFVAIASVQGPLSKENAGWVTAGFLASWLIWLLSFGIAALIAESTFDRLLSDASARRNHHSNAPPEALLSAVERISIAQSWEKNGAAWPLITFGLLFPLTLHFAIAMTGDLTASNFARFGNWIILSILTVGHVHVVVAICAWLHAKRIARTPTATLGLELRYFGAKAYVVIVGSALFSVIAFASHRKLSIAGNATASATIAMLIVAATAMPIVPFFSSLRKSVLKQRQLLDRALLGSDEGLESRIEKLTAIASWIDGPENLRILAFDALAERGQRVHTRVLIDKLLPGAPMLLRQKLLAVALELYHRPPLEMLLSILRVARDPATLRPTCRLLQLMRDPSAEPDLLVLLGDHPDEVVIAAADALARCGTITAIEPLKKITEVSFNRPSLIHAAQNAIDQIQARMDPSRGRGELSLVVASEAGAVSFAAEDGGLSIAADRSPT